MKKYEPCEIVIRYNRRQMPLTSLLFLEQELKRIGDSYTPKLKVRTEEVVEP